LTRPGFTNVSGGESHFFSDVRLTVFTVAKNEDLLYNTVCGEIVPILAWEYTIDETQSRFCAS